MDCVLTLDAGSSSVRTLAFSFDGKAVEGLGSRIEYRAHVTQDGGWEIGAGDLTTIVVRAIDEICAQFRTKNIKPAAVAADTFWHSVLGVAADAKPTTPILHPFDTRSAGAAKRLAQRIDNAAQHKRTGCMLHPSYVPSKVLWLQETQPDSFGRVKRWMSAGEYLFLNFFGEPAASTSMVSATGFWNQNANDYDAEMLDALPVSRDQFADPANLDQPSKTLNAEFAHRWPELNGIPWFPALGDGACDNIGSGCTTPERFALMVGTSGALRTIIEADRIDIPDGLFCYRADRTRFAIGGALTNGGSVFAWMKQTLRLPEEDALEKQLAALKPGREGLTILPLFAGERSTGWRSEARAAITGLGANTSPVEILYAALESVALRFRGVYEIMQASLGEPKEVVASGGALLNSPLWTRMVADAIGHSMISCREPEATSRGAALLALERIGAIRSIHDLKPAPGETIEPDPENRAIYDACSRTAAISLRKIVRG